MSKIFNEFCQVTERIEHNSAMNQKHNHVKRRSLKSSLKYQQWQMVGF